VLYRRDTGRYYSIRRRTKRDFQIGTIRLSKRHRLYLLGAYVAVVVVAFLYFNIPLLVEWVALILFVGALIAGRADLFFRDWGAFLAALLAWQFTAPVATQLSTPWHLTELIDADRFMFHGVVPSAWLQAHLYHPGVLEPWDVLAVAMYSLHFFTPLIVGFVLWLTNRPLFHKFAFAFVLVAVAGFSTYIVYPAVPPWLAAHHLVAYHHHFFRVAHGGHVYLPGVRNIFDITAHHWYNSYNGQISIGFLHQHIDQIGAMPSQHAAFPFLCLLFLRRQFGRWSHLGWLYIVAITFSIVYLGQHYVIDALVGFVYAALGYAFVMYALPRLQSFLARRFQNRSRAGAHPLAAPTHHFAAEDERPGDASSL
jgi:membrane-associated phospholipid phosphatase